MRIDAPLITGSLSYNGTSLQDLSTYATTSSVNNLIQKTGSYALTGSNYFSGSQVISGSITATGNITAQTLIIQTVTSSVLFSTGSNKLGSSLSNTQELTGSVGITGSISVNGAATFSSTGLFQGETLTIGSAVAATNVKLFLNGVASKAAGIEFRQSGVSQWFIGNGIASEDNNFELYNSNGTMAMKIIKSTNAIAFIGAATFSGEIKSGDTITLGAAAVGGFWTWGSTTAYLVAGTGKALNLNPNGTSGTTGLSIATTGEATFSSSVTANSLSIGSTTNSTGPTSGAIVSSGGLGLRGDIFLQQASANGSNYGYIKTVPNTVNTTTLTIGTTYGFNVNVDAVSFFNGNATFSGSVSKGSGSFRIKHPLLSKKSTHQLVHSFIEGPQADLIYRGKIRLSAGKAIINIDEASTMTEGTFEALCREVQCFTSNETGWGAVRGKVTGNILTIESQNIESTDEISWMVVGERQDEHMMDTEWTDSNGKVIVEPLVTLLENK